MEADGEALFLQCLADFDKGDEIFGMAGALPHENARGAFFKPRCSLCVVTFDLVT